MPRKAVIGLARVHVEAATDGLVLTLDIEHRYENASAQPIEVVYTFPVPSDAVILGVSSMLDGRRLPVAVRDTAVAEDAFEDAQIAQGFAALIERRSPGLCTASLGRLAPGASAALSIKLGLFLESVGGYARIVAPSVATIPEGSIRAVGPLGAPSASFHADYSLTFRLTLVGAAAAVYPSSPTHALKRDDADGVVLTLAQPATLDRDVVVTLHGLPAEDGGWTRQAGGRLAVVALTPPSTADERQPINAVVLIDAAGPLGPVVGDAADLLNVLVSEWEDDDKLYVGRIGRTLSPAEPSPCGPNGLDLAALGTGVGDLGDIAPGAPPPAFNLPPDADLCLITDGRTRIAEALARRASAEGRRLFVIGVGAAPDAGWLHPAALAGGGDYIGLSPGEPLEVAAHRLLGALTLPAIPRPPAQWSGAPVWDAGPPVWRSGVRSIVCAAYADDHPATVAVSFERDRPARRVPQRGAQDALAQAAARVAAARRLPALKGEAQKAWAQSFDLGDPASVWIAHAADVRIDGAEAALVTTPQMVAAGWRGVGRLEPVPGPIAARPPPSPPPAPTAPPQPPPHEVSGARRPSPVWIIAAAAVLIFVAALGLWASRQAPPAPTVAPSAAARDIQARALATNGRGDATGSTSRPVDDASKGASSRSSGLEVAVIAVLATAAAALGAWLYGRRRRRG